MNVVLILNVASILCVGCSVLIVGYYPIWALGLCFISGLITSQASRFDIHITEEPDEDLPNKRTGDGA